ncbi:hypothetical protein Tco_0495084, partial [Tanacetum coccineum]
IELPGDLKEILTKLENFTSNISSLTPEEKLNTVVENASGVARNNVPSADKAIASPTKGEKNTNPSTMDAKPNLHDELVDILGIDVVTQYYNKKLL